MDGQRNVFDIDETRLDEEWLAQPRHARRAGVAEADAAHELAKAKARLGVVEAKLRMAVRRRPGDYGVKPGSRGITEAQITEAVTCEDEYRDAVDAVNRAAHYADLCKVDVAATADRRRALERLVELLALDYYAAPRVRSSDGRRAVENMTQDSARKPIRKADLVLDADHGDQGNRRRSRDMVGAYVGTYADTPGSNWGGPCMKLEELTESYPGADVEKLRPQIFQIRGGDHTQLVREWDARKKKWVGV